MRFIVSILMIFAAAAYGSTPIEFHAHQVRMSGVLPAPYHTLEFEIRLDEETDDVIEFTLIRGGELIHIPQEVISSLKNIELGTLQVMHEMHRTQEEPAKSRFGGRGDWLHFVFEHGERYRADKEENGKQWYKWGRDRIKVTITKDRQVSVTKIRLVDTYEGWLERSW